MVAAIAIMYCVPGILVSPEFSMVAAIAIMYCVPGILCRNSVSPEFSVPSWRYLA
jgi:hypothetical protein